MRDCGREKANQTETICLTVTVSPISPNGCTNTRTHISTHIHTHAHTHAYTKQFSAALFLGLWTLLPNQSHSSLSMSETLCCYWIALFLLAEDGEFRRLFFWTVSVPLTASLKYYRIYKHQIIIYVLPKSYIH